MKKRTNRILAMLMTLGMTVCSMGAVPVAAEEATDVTADKAVIAKFDTADAVKSFIQNAQGLEIDMKKTYGDSPYSIKWDYSGTTTDAKRTTAVNTADKGINWANYDYFVVRYYAETAGVQVSVMPNVQGVNYVEGVSYYRWIFTTKATGWQEAIIPLSKFYPTREPSWDAVSGVYLATGFGGDTSCDNAGYMYIDEMWLENNDSPKTTDNIGSSDLVLMNVASDADLPPNNVNPTKNQASSQNETITSFNRRAGGNVAYATIDVDASSNNTSYYLYNGSSSREQLNLSSYKYLNLWIYSPKAINGDLSIGMTSKSYLTVNGETTKATNEINGTASLGALDWIGWKLVTVDMEIINACVNATKDRKFDPSHVYRIWITANSTYSPWAEDGYYGIEKIWLSNEKPTSETVLIPETGVETKLPEGNLLLANYSGQDKVAASIGSNADVCNPIIQNANTSNNRLFDANIRSNKWSSNEGFVMSLYQAPVANGFPLLTVNGLYNYVNFWLYSPGSRKNGNSTSQLSCVVWCHKGNGAVGNIGDHKGNTAYQKYNINMDWTGWKLISIPLGDYIKSRGLHGVYLYANSNQWITTTSNAAVAWNTENNFVDVDMVWLSKDAPTAFALSEALVSDKEVDVLTDTDLMYSFTNELEEGAADKISVYNDYEPLVKGTDYEVVVNGSLMTVNFTNALKSDSSYQVKLDNDLRDVYGNDLSAGDNVVYSFTTAPKYRITDAVITKTDDSKASASASVKVFEGEAKSFVVILGEYSADGSLVKAAITTTDTLAAQESKTFSTEAIAVSENNTLKAFIWDGFESMNPYPVNFVTQ